MNRLPTSDLYLRHHRDLHSDLRDLLKEIKESHERLEKKVLLIRDKNFYSLVYGSSCPHCAGIDSGAETESVEEEDSDYIPDTDEDERPTTKRTRSSVTVTFDTEADSNAATDEEEILPETPRVKRRLFV